MAHVYRGLLKKCLPDDESLPSINPQPTLNALRRHQFTQEYMGMQWVKWSRKMPIRCFTMFQPSRITFPVEAVAALRRHRVRQNEERLSHADIWHDLDFVFATNSGRAIAASNFWREYRRIVTRAGLPYIRPHDLRHTRRPSCFSRVSIPRR